MLTPARGRAPRCVCSPLTQGELCLNLSTLILQVCPLAGELVPHFSHFLVVVLFKRGVKGPSGAPKHQKAVISIAKKIRVR